jgi:methionyl-tRNA synthetase
VAAAKVPETDKLLQLTVSFGEETRQIVSGIAPFFPDPLVLVGKKGTFILNLEPRVIRGLESRGMLLAASSGEAFSLLEVASAIPAGTVIK